MGLKLLNEPINIGTMNLKNRLVMPPMATAKSSPEGSVSEDLLNYYREYASGKIGLIIVEHAFVSKRGRASDLQLSVSEDMDVIGLSKLAQVIKQNGTMAMMQINHAGSATRESITGKRLVTSSPMHHPGKKMPTGETPHELTIEEMKLVVDVFTRAAVRVKRAGFDGVEIHAAHGYLLNQFYSPLTNKRNDQYGGSLENRLRLHCEVIQGVREAVGDFPIAVRLGGCDYREGGSTVDDAVKAAKILENEGIDLLDVSGGIGGYNVPGRTEPGWFKEMSSAIVQAVRIPVMLTGGVVASEQAEALLAARAANLIGVGRAMFEDSTWADREVR
ncbi:MAG: NADH:flavin oxidoreductase [Bacillota bacterium]|nr:NADH:flavin oxidoreductase [Bacillota bacterium]